MLFNSYVFILAFLPLAAGVFYLLGQRTRDGALAWLILASLVFYAWWRPLNVLLIAPSILLNFWLSRRIQHLLRSDRPAAAKTVLVLGILFNLAFLGYFKYANFFVGAVNDVTGTHFVLSQIVLPLGISFITFQKIAFLVDVYSKRVEEFTLRDYTLFVLFFPQLIAGPIVHYREMMPQFQRATCRYDRDNLLVGVTLFAFGLFKKAFLADRIAPLVSELYAHAGAANETHFFLAWLAAIGFTFQIYFDFSGYTDMALGIARLFGIKLPPNFNSPLRSKSIIEFWLRWHLTLTRFLTAYIYNPLSLRLTRQRMAKGLPGLGGKHSSPGAFFVLLFFPTLLTMVISGIWHGAGYLFILWGALHGLLLSVNHAWRLFARRRWPDRRRYERVMAPIGFVLTFLSVSAAMVLFRSTSVAAAIDILRGMAGLNGVALPDYVFAKLGALGPALHHLGIVAYAQTYFPFNDMVRWTAVLALIAFVAPNTLQMLARWEPALGYKSIPADDRGFLSRLTWSPSVVWALVVASLAAIGLAQLTGPSEFLYWQF